ncbi:hypothetical protein [Alkalibacillus haloalkaliphilus]|uniref:hypothetical protein n=1 Tax=Alkalibacillus haloalkaliphilus TaxID=94136 RepID=UPI00293562D1|nr:hypothetical protein [Alkalibacillus haloalkaliphilus]MDV2583484.1 hypothetical protein [Alkalibacillus haloalkaliphilus]
MSRSCQSWRDIGGGLQARDCEGQMTSMASNRNVSFSPWAVHLLDADGNITSSYNYSDLGISESVGSEFKKSLEKIFDDYVTFGVSNLDLSIEFDLFDLFSITASGSVYAYQAEDRHGLRQYKETEYQGAIDIETDNLLAAFEMAVALVAILATRNLAAGRISGTIAREGVEYLMRRVNAIV